MTAREAGLAERIQKAPGSLNGAVGTVTGFAGGMHCPTDIPAGRAQGSGGRKATGLGGRNGGMDDVPRVS